MTYIYLHGFASGPQSRKAQFFKQRFADRGIDLAIPTLDGGNFEGLTITGQLSVIAGIAQDQPCTLIGSSLGGYLSALYAARHPEVERLVLMAPAFCFPNRWKADLGEEEYAAWEFRGKRTVFHYGEKRNREIGFQLISDGLYYEDYPVALQPALILHGRNDTVVPVEFSREFVQRHPNNVKLLELDSDHELGDVLESLWLHTEAFLFQK